MRNERMSVLSPDELLASFHKNMDVINGSGDLDHATRRKIYEELAEVYNYLSALNSEPSAERIIRSQSAQAAKQYQQLEKERGLLDQHKDFVENTIDKADQYLKTIQLGGYAVFFALWGLTNQHINQTLASLSAIFMILSVAVFVLWEIWKATILTLAINRHASITSDLESFVKNRYRGVIEKHASAIYRAKQRVWIWILCVTTAIFSSIILLIALIVDLIV